MNEMTRLFEAFSQRIALESIAIKAAMCMPCLLQKPHAKSKVKEHTSCLKRRMDHWEAGEFSLLISEENMIQQCINVTRRNIADDDAKIARTFAKLMNDGKIRAATQFLSRKQSKGVHNLDKEISGKSVRDILKEKHPTARPANPDILLNMPSTGISESLHQ